jgi:acyl carrier protein
VPIGRPIANIEMFILDEGQEPVPVGVRGEIYISGEGLARGYVARPELTGEKFIPNGLGRNGGERMYRTGDLARYLADGNIEFIGRADGQVKVRGYRIELGEIEAVLNEHRLVKRSVVVARNDECGIKRLLGYVVGEEGMKGAELRRHARERLPEYMVPEAIVVLEELPLTANGKIDRKRLLLGPSATCDVRELEEEYAWARTPVEEIVVGIFEEVLKLSRIGVRDNFFEIGGHSLLATQVVSRVRKTFGVEMELRSIFEKVTAEGLAVRIEEAMRAWEKDSEKQLDYWKKQYREKLPVLNLPADHPRLLVSSYRGGAKSFLLSAELSQSLKALSRREGVTLFMVLLAAFKTLLYRYTAQEEIIIGTAVANRNRAEIEPFLGFFVNMLPIRTDLGDNPRFRELLRRVKDVVLDGYIHQDLPFEKLAEEIEMPLFKVAFGVQNAGGEDLRMNAIKIRPMVVEPEGASLDLTLWMTEGIEGVEVDWVYNQNLFEERTIIRMYNHFETLLFNIVGRPNARLTALKVKSRAEPRLSEKEQSDREETDIRKLMSVKRKGIKLPTEPI